MKMNTDIMEDDRVELLMEETGMAGLGVFKLLLWMLGRKPRQRCNISILKGTARKYKIAEELLAQVTQAYNLFAIVEEGEDSFLTSLFLLDEAEDEGEDPEDKRGKLVAGGKKRASTAKRTANGRFTSHDQLRDNIVVEEEVEEVYISASATADAEDNITHKKKKKMEMQEKKEVKKGLDLYTDQAIADREWLCVLAMQNKLPMLERTAEIAAIFKQHVVAQGNEERVLSLRDAKNYMANFLRLGTMTRKRVEETLNKQEKEAKKSNPHRFEEVDPATGNRYYCGVLIPSDAPPRPDENAIWLNNEWTR